MKAIDFSCNILKMVGKSKLSPAGARVIFCIAAGLRHRQDIDNYLDTGSSNGSFNTLRHLEAQGYIQELPPYSNHYKLTPQGRELVARLLSFLPTKH